MNCLVLELISGRVGRHLSIVRRKGVVFLHFDNHQLQRQRRRARFIRICALRGPYALRIQ